MRILAIVPARGGSQRIPRKNLALLGDRTLVRRALDTALQAGCFDAVVLSSDDDEILREADGSAAVAIRRPAELATAESRTFDAVRHVLARLEQDASRFDAVAVVQATSPFTAPEDLAGAVELLARTGAESVVSIVRVEAVLHPLKLKTLEPDGRLVPYLADDALAPSQKLPPLWIRNGSVYLSRREVIERGLMLSDKDTRGYEMPAGRSLDIDTPRDLAFARFLFEQPPAD